MKKLKSLVFVFALVLGTTAFAADTEPEGFDPEVRAHQIETRVHELWKMDYSEMDKAEKLQIKEELKSIKKELKTQGLDSRVSISVGAIIIILLIIIIIA